MTPRPCCEAQTLYLLSCAETAEGGGVYRYALSNDGRLTEEARLPCPMPMYAVYGGGRLHILLRAPFAESENSGYISCAPDFSDLTAPHDTQGRCACHLTADGGAVYIANYLSGNLTRIAKNGCTAVTHSGRGSNLPRQDAPHPHFVCLSPDGKYLLCSDLGLDTVFFYDRELREVSRAKVPDGHGVRHLVFAPDGRHFYAVNELIPSVSRFSYENGKAVCLDTVPLPCAASGATAAAIRTDEDGKRLYVSVRGEDRLFVLDTGSGRPSLIADAPCGGRGPRDFALFGDRIVCTNENSDNVTVLDKRTLSLLGEIPLRAPLCVL